MLVTLAIALFTVAFAVLGNKLGGEFRSVSSQNGADSRIVIVIDAGHGGEDGGAQSTDGILEKDINLAIAKYLDDYLFLSGFETVMTRSDDRLLYGNGEQNRKKFYDVRNRAEIAKQYDNSIFVSIHQNKFPIEKYSGLQVYYSKNDPRSKTLANIIQSSVKEKLQPKNNRETKAAGSNIYILNNAESPAVLVECGFLSNGEEARKLNDKEYQKKLAFVIFTSVTEFCRTYNDTV